MDRKSETKRAQANSVHKSNWVDRAAAQEKIMLAAQQTPSILVVYGRRRVGKTSLIERTLGNRNMIKIEGLEDKGPAAQRKHALDQIAQQLAEPFLGKIVAKSWIEIFELLATKTKEGTWTIFLEELQWMASYSHELVSDLKYVWDNMFIRNQNLLLVLCGSSPSFMIEKVMRSRALYNRSQHELHLKELSLAESSQLLGSRYGPEQVLDAYLTVGGIPEYLKYLKRGNSAYLAIAQQSFLPDSFFFNEIDRVFVSSLAKNPFYKAAIKTLAKGPQTRTELQKAAGVSLGGTRATLIEDLILCGFVDQYSPLQLGEASRDAKLYLSDNYLNFYYRCVAPRAAQIKQSRFTKTPTAALPINQFRQLLGFAFERLCWKNAHRIAELLGFAAVEYSAGPFYRRGDKTGSQIDLVFKRADKVLVVCEIKYQAKPPGKEVITGLEARCAELRNAFPRFGLRTVLISPNGQGHELNKERYFDHVISINQIISNF